NPLRARELEHERRGRHHPTPARVAVWWQAPVRLWAPSSSFAFAVRSGPDQTRPRRPRQGVPRAHESCSGSGRDSCGPPDSPRPATRHDRVAALRAGAWGCLSEPFDAEEVLALIGTFGAAKLAADRARVAGLVDEETGLYNVRGLTRRAREVASHASRAHAALACVVLAPDAEVPEPDVAPGDLPPTVLQPLA